MLMIYMASLLILSHRGSQCYSRPESFDYTSLLVISPPSHFPSSPGYRAKSEYMNTKIKQILPVYSYLKVSAFDSNAVFFLNGRLTITN